jgi:CDP-diglyceride synthetase
MHTPSPHTLKTLQRLTYAGLLPFLLLLLLMGSRNAQWQAFAQNAMALYTVAIISFVGAVSWGIALGKPDLSDAERQVLLVWSVLPSLLTCLIGLLLSGRDQWLGFALLVLLACAADHRLGRQLGWPRVWLQLRLRISLLVSATLLAAAGVGAFLSKAQA